MNMWDDINMRRVANLLGLPFPDEMELGTYFIIQDIYRAKLAKDQETENEYQQYLLSKKLAAEIEERKKFDPSFIQIKI